MTDYPPQAGRQRIDGGDEPMTFRCQAVIQFDVTRPESWWVNGTNEEQEAEIRAMFPMAVVFDWTDMDFPPEEES